MIEFTEAMKSSQIKWRRSHLSIQTPGRQNNRAYEYILPWQHWALNLWPALAEQGPTSLPQYLHENRIRKHTGSHNLLSSWALCANLYFPFRDPSGLALLASYLREYVSPDIGAVTSVELEYEATDPGLKPIVLLGETDGGRGAGQTSPDVAFEVRTSAGIGVVLVESKFTEHHFYPCSGRKKRPGGRAPNPDVKRCLDPVAILRSPQAQCHLTSWGRKYWTFLAPVADPGAMVDLKCCPAAFDGYQLFRQHALAEALAGSRRFASVFSCVAYDSRNTDLMHCLDRSTGLRDITREWNRLFKGGSRFVAFTHQSWASWVASNAAHERSSWLGYIHDRYGIP